MFMEVIDSMDQQKLENALAKYSSLRPHSKEH